MPASRRSRKRPQNGDPATMCLLRGPRRSTQEEEPGIKDGKTSEQFVFVFSLKQCADL